MKSLMLLLQWLLIDLGSRCGVSTSRDFKTVSARVEHEGLSFLAITLPNFAKDFQKSLEQGFVSDDQFLGFKRTGGLPSFMRGFLQNVFNSGDGRLLDNPDIDSIFAIRQFTLFCSKILVEPSKARIKDAIDGFIECEKSVRLADKTRSEEALYEFSRISHLIFRDLFTAMDSDIYYNRIIPRHGPGTTASGLLGNKKYRNRDWSSRLEEFFPAREFLFSRIGLSFDKDDINWLEPGSEPPVRVVTVPKTLKSPRIIAIEPVYVQYVQQGIMLKFVERIEEDNLSSSFIRFLDQLPNQQMAWRGSLLGDRATLDLSEASDRVSNQLVRAMLSRWPSLMGAIDSCRSRKADVPGHGVIRLAKFASMGSALCFPIESMVFITAVFVGIQKQLKRPLTRKDIESFRGQVRTYGDDIIVPVEYTQSVIESLELYGLKVNSHKSYWNGKFRESCGRDFYDGFDISICRIRRFLPESRSHCDELISAVSLRNQLFELGMGESVRYLDSVIERFIPFPYVHPNSSVLGRSQWMHRHDVDYWDPELQRPMVKGAVVHAPLPLDRLDGVDALTKVLLQKAHQTEKLNRYGELEGEWNPFRISVATDHLQRAGRAHSVRIKVGRYSPL